MGKIVELYHNQIEHNQVIWICQALTRNAKSSFISGIMMNDILEGCHQNFNLTSLCQVLEFDTKTGFLTKEWSDKILEKIIELDLGIVMKCETCLQKQKSKGRGK